MFALTLQATSSGHLARSCLCLIDTYTPKTFFHSVEPYYNGGLSATKGALRGPRSEIKRTKGAPLPSTKVFHHSIKSLSYYYSVVADHEFFIQEVVDAHGHGPRATGHGARARGNCLHRRRPCPSPEKDNDQHSQILTTLPDCLSQSVS